MADFERWRDIVYNPCNKSAERRNTAAIKEALEGLAENQASGDSSLMPFVVTGPPANNIVPVKVVDRAEAPWSFTIEKQAYDPTGRVFTANMKTGHYGYCRLLPEQDEDAVEIITLEGRVRFFTGELEVDMAVDNTATASADFMFGDYPNSKDLVQATGIVVHDRTRILVNQPAGTKIIAILDEREDEYVALGPPRSSSGDAVVPFVVTEIGLNGVCAVKIVDRTDSPPWKFTLARRAYDPYYKRLEVGGAAHPDARGLFFRNMRVGHYGYCREYPDHPDGNDVVEIISLEGLARFITGELADDMSTWANLTVEYDFGAFPNSYPVTGNVPIFDRLEMMQNQVAGTKAMGVYDEDKGEYVAVGPQKFISDEPGAMHQIKICDTTTNSCCMLLGMAFKMIGVQDGLCGAQVCGQPVFVTCENRNLEQFANYTSLSPAGPNVFSITDGFGGSTVNQDFCGWARDTGLTMTCDGSTLPVYTVRCECEPCECPDILANPGLTIRAIHTPADINHPDCPFPNFDLTCVLQDPISEDPPDANEEYWWGEFTMNGYYPRVGTPVDIDEVIVNGEAIDVMHMVWLPINDDPCHTSNWEAWANVLGDWVKYNGTINILNATAGGVEEPIVDDRGFSPLFPTTYRYGVIALCDSTVPAVPVMSGFKIYHIPRNTVASVNDACSLPGGTMVPPAGSDIGDDDLTGDAGDAIDCCQIGQRFEADGIFSNSDPTCTTQKPFMSSSGFVVNGREYTHHYLGGCPDIIAKGWKAIGGDFVQSPSGDTLIEFANDTPSNAGWKITWAGSPEKDLCP